MKVGKDGWVIDARYSDNISKFINHSCNPNAHVQEWDVLGELRLGIFASRDIHAGEEILYDYFYMKKDSRLECKCREKNCRWL
mmetsp:Transcript_41994/g.68125  ORF Transcript_41994/g.68125 Transcript_41994/m.68125 type:complete len:83 (+) Transcript_41994:208-456(+)